MSSLFGVLLGLSISLAPTGSTALNAPAFQDFEAHLDFDAPLDLRHTHRESAAVQWLDLYGRPLTTREVRLDDAPPLVAAFDPLVDEILELVLGGLPVLTVDPFSPEAMVRIFGTF